MKIYQNGSKIALALDNFIRLGKQRFGNAHFHLFRFAMQQVIIQLPMEQGTARRHPRTKWIALYQVHFAIQKGHIQYITGIQDKFYSLSIIM